MFPSSFAGPLGVTLMAQYGRGEERMRTLAVEGARYAYLIAVPLLVGAAFVLGCGLWSYLREDRVALALLVLPALVTIGGALAGRASPPQPGLAPGSTRATRTKEVSTELPHT